MREDRLKLCTGPSAILVTAMLLSGCTVNPSVTPESSGVSGQSDVSHANASVETSPARALVTTVDGAVVIEENTVRSISDASNLYAAPASDGKHIYLRERGGNSIGLVNLGDGKGTEFIELGLPVNKPTHIVSHNGVGVIYNDGDGTATVFEESQIFAGGSDHRVIETSRPHHGVAVPLGENVVITVPSGEVLPQGVSLRDPQGKEITQVLECPELHGEGIANNQAAFGCSDGVLVLSGDRDRKISYPVTDGRRVGMFASPSDDNSILAGSFYSEGEAPTAVMLIDLSKDSAIKVDLPSAYTGFARSHDGSVWVATSDGKLVEIDEENGEILSSTQIAPEGERPMEAFPQITTDDTTVYFADPSSLSIYYVDITSKTVIETITLESAPTSITTLNHTR